MSRLENTIISSPKIERNFNREDPEATFKPKINPYFGTVCYLFLFYFIFILFYFSLFDSNLYYFCFLFILY